jgi:hypothetical protein
MSCDQKTRLEQELATVPRSEEAFVLWRHRKYSQGLTGREREDLLNELEDILVEKISG